MIANKVYFNLYVWYFGTFLLTSGFFLEKDLLTKYIKKYEIVDCHVSTSRTRRNAQTKDGKRKDLFDTEVRFTSHDTGFHLLLLEDKAFRNLPVESYSPNNITKSEEVNITLFEGILDNDTTSYAAGYMQNQAFVGIIKFYQTLFFVEPASKFFSHSKSNKIVVYKEDDVVLENISAHGDINSTTYSYKTRVKLNSPGDKFKGINKTNNPNEEYACKIELVSDHTLYEYFKKDVNLLTAYLYLHVKFSDLIFRQTDFDGDGKRDRIRIIPVKVFIYKTANDFDSRMKIKNTIRAFLILFSLRTQNFCLSVCLVYRSSPDSVLGVAYTSTRDEKYVGGICQKPVSSETGKNISLNTVVVSVRSDNGVPFPLPVSSLILTHELGHSFGSSHDPLDDLYCTPGEPKGLYLMHFESEPGLKRINRLFSPCSRKAIATVISSKGECLKPYPAFCGNGIQEGNEECDCGNEASCFYIDHCCTPSDAAHPEEGCTFRRSMGFVCSAKENECCLNDCRIDDDSKFMCYNGDAACLLSYCDGKRATCPEPKPAPDKYPCRSSTKTCLNGYCNSSVCLDNGLKDCACRYPFECYLCCQKDDQCLPVPSFGFVLTSGASYFVLEGTPCKDEKYQCNGAGDCVNPLDRDLYFTLRSQARVYWILSFSAITFFVAISVLAYSVERIFLYKK